jgi:hypothetical protein
VGDINTKTIKRKAKTDPHSISNFLPEEQEGEQEGEGCCFHNRTTMCGTGRKRYEFTQVGGRRKGKKGKSMVQAPPPPPPLAVKPKRKPMSQKEYCSLYRCY